MVTNILETEEQKRQRLLAKQQQQQQAQQMTQGQQNEANHNIPSPVVYPTQNYPGQPIQPVLSGYQPQLQQNAQQQNNLQSNTSIQGQPLQPQTAIPQQPITQENLLQAGREKVMQGFQSPLTQQTSNVTSNLLANPSMYTDLTAYKQNELDKYNREAANTTEAIRQQLAGTMNVGGLSNQQLGDLGLKLFQGRNDLSTQLNTEEQNRKREDLYAALDAARQSSELERKRFETDIGSLTGLLGAGEGTEQRTFEDLQAEKQRTWQSSEASLGRLNALDLATIDVEGKKELANIQGKIQSGLQLKEQDFLGYQNALERDLKAAMQSEDINARNQALQAQIEFDRWKTEAGFELTAEQNALDRGLQLSLQSNDEGFQERMLKIKEAIDLNMMMTDNDWKGIQADLQRQMDLAIADKNITAQMEIQKTQQEFTAVQNDLNRKQDITLNEMQFEQEKWKTNQVEQLTKLGWSHEDAMQQADIQNKVYLAEYEGKIKQAMQGAELSQRDKELLQQATQFKDKLDFEKHVFNENWEQHELDKIWEMNKLAQQQAFQSSQSSLDRQLQKEIEAGRIGIEEKKLLDNMEQFKTQMAMKKAEMIQQGQQFDENLEFQKWATQKGFDEKSADRAWQAYQNALDRTHDLVMQDLQQKFAEKNMSFQVVVSQMSNMSAEQAAEFLNNTAINAGITYIDDKGQVQKGIKPYTANQIIDTQSVNTLKAIDEKFANNKNITQEEYNAIIKSKTIPQMIEQGGEWGWTHETWDARDSKSGSLATRFTDPVWEYLNGNKGKVVALPDGNVVRIISFWEPGTAKDDRKKVANVTFQNVVTGETRTIEPNYPNWFNQVNELATKTNTTRG